MDADVKTKCFILLGIFLHFGTFRSSQAETHSLYYIYTGLSKPVNLPGIHQFTAMGLLDDIQIDYYDNIERKKIPKLEWLKEKIPADYWERGTQTRLHKEHWFNMNIQVLMERMNQSSSDLHVLQWRVGCEIEKQENKFQYSKGISEYAYDGEDFLSFDHKTLTWVASNPVALITKIKWKHDPNSYQYTRVYLENICVDWLNKFREYGENELKKVSLPEVHVSARKSCSDKNKIDFTCLATGFYPKDVTLIIRKNRTPLPDTEIKSTGVRPNHDGTYQIQKSVEIMENDKEDYDCYVTRKTQKEGIVIKWGGKC